MINKIKKYDNIKINDSVIREMYDILIENLFINYPEFLDNRSKYDDDKNFEKWKNSITCDNNYKYILLYKNDMLICFFTYTIVNDNYWISEVQITDKYKRSGLLRKLIYNFCFDLSEIKPKKIFIHINSNNSHLREVFEHIGFGNCDKTIYSIDFNKLKEWGNI